MSRGHNVIGSQLSEAAVCHCQQGEPGAHTPLITLLDQAQQPMILGFSLMVVVCSD